MKERGETGSIELVEQRMGKSCREATKEEVITALRELSQENFSSTLLIN
jgi:hypothetical protein